MTLNFTSSPLSSLHSSVSSSLLPSSTSDQFVYPPSDEASQNATISVISTEHTRVFSSDGVIRGLDQITISRLVAALQCVLLGILWVIALPGNILVFTVVQRSRRVQSTTNYFVKSLAVSDILLVLMTSPAVCVRVVVSEWTAGHVFCRLVRFLQLSNMACCAFVLVAICVDRFYTIVYPLSFKITRGTAKRAILFAWVSSALLSMFSIYFFDLVHVPSNQFNDLKDPQKDRHVCPTFVPASALSGRIYAFAVVTLYFIFPVIVTGVGYLQIMCFIHRTRISFQTNRMSGALIPRRKVKMARTLLIITAITLIFYLPFFTTQLIYCVGWTNFLSPHIFNSSYCLIAASAAAKPVIYACRNSVFWRGCQEVLCMSGMKCYRVNTYTITKVSTIAKKNFVGVMELSQDSMNSGGGGVGSVGGGLGGRVGYGGDHNMGSMSIHQSNIKNRTSLSMSRHQNSLPTTTF